MLPICLAHFSSEVITYRSKSAMLIVVLFLFVFLIFITSRLSRMFISLSFISAMLFGGLVIKISACGRGVWGFDSYSFFGRGFFFVCVILDYLFFVVSERSQEAYLAYTQNEYIYI